MNMQSIDYTSKCISTHIFISIAKTNPCIERFHYTILPYIYIFLTKGKKGAVIFIFQLAEMLSNDHGHQLQYNMPMPATKALSKMKQAKLQST